MDEKSEALNSKYETILNTKIQITETVLDPDCQTVAGFFLNIRISGRLNIQSTTTLLRLDIFKPGP